MNNFNIASKMTLKVSAISQSNLVFLEMMLNGKITRVRQFLKDME